MQLTFIAALYVTAVSASALPTSRAHFQIPKLADIIKVPEIHARRLSDMEMTPECMQGMFDLPTACGIELDALASLGDAANEDTVTVISKICTDGDPCNSAFAALGACMGDSLDTNMICNDIPSGECLTATTSLTTSCGISFDEDFNPTGEQMAELCGDGQCGNAFSSFLSDCSGQPGLEDLGGDCSEIMANGNSDDNDDSDDDGECTATCQAYPANCVEAESMVSEGGCASSCSKKFISSTLEDLGCQVHSIEPKVVSVVMTADGTVEDFGESEKAAIKTTFASQVGVSEDKCTVTVTSASVNIQVDIEAAGAATADAIKTSLDPVVADASSATNFLRQAVPTATVTSAPAMQIEAQSSGGGSCGGGCIGGIIGGCFVPTLLCILWLSGAFGDKCPSPCKKKEEKQPTFSNTNTGQAA